ncbi:MAG: Lsm family RNA-binding protein [Aigarchaeota archaeon]|nr:Lsm family RNA-binding protein [Candidatus Pelearchaeum maunauluense]
MSSAIVSKRFSDEFSALLDRTVKVATSHGTYEGRLLAYNPSDYSVWLSDARDERGGSLPKVFINGQSISRIELLEAGPDMMKLVERLNRLFPNLVTYLRESDTILVMDRIRVTRSGVVGEGPAAEKVKRVYEEFMKEEEAKKG